MKHDLTEAIKECPQLHIAEGSDVSLNDNLSVELDEIRKHRQYQKEIEDFWAGRNLAARNSTRKAA